MSDPSSATFASRGPKRSAAAAAASAAVAEVGEDERERDRELDQCDHREAGRESQRKKREEECGSSVLEQVAS
jgi:hypothetical protein